MAKKKNVTPVEEVKEVEINEEKVQEEPSKEKICEFYGIQDAELLSPECDLSKYGLSEQEEEVLLNWKCQNKIVNVDNIRFDIYTTNKEAWAIIAKYGITPKEVAEWNMELLSEEEIEKLKERDPDIINSGEINASKYSYIYVYCDVNSTSSPAPTSDMLKISYQTQ